MARNSESGAAGSERSAALPAILDCDTGHDDAMAILLAARKLDLRGVTTVHGNATVELTTVNTCKVLELAGLDDVPVAVGAAQSLKRRISHAPGCTASPGWTAPICPRPPSSLSRRPRSSSSPGPRPRWRGCTSSRPDRSPTSPPRSRPAERTLATRIAGLSLMGGSTGPGNASAVAEFNVWADPEAADVVFRSGVPIKMVGLNVTRQVPATPRHRQRVRALGTRTAVAVAELLEFFSEQLEQRYGLPGASMHDPLAVSALADPQVLRFESMQVDVELAGEHTCGMTVCDYRHLSAESAGMTRQRDPLGRPNAEVAVAVDAERFWEQFVEVLATYP